MNPHKHRLIQSAGLIGGLAGLSRVFGMLRDIASASLFGTTAVWDAFVLAFTIPNLLRRLVFEGALSSAFIPIFVEILKTKGRQEAGKFANQVGTALFLIVIIITAGFYSGLIALNAFGLITGKWVMVFDFLIVLFPYLFFLLAVALSMGILNSEKHFFTPALSPLILNLAWISAVMLICPALSRDRVTQVKILCFVIVISGAIQLLIQWFPLAARKYQLKLMWNFSSPHVSRFMKLILPSIVGFSVFNLNMLVDLIFGYFLTSGSSSSLWYAGRLMQLPLGIFAASLGTVLLPEYSHQAAENNLSRLRNMFSFSLRSVFLVMLPATVGLIALAHPIVRLLFERGEFTATSTAQTQAVLVAYTLGLPAYAALQVIVSAFYGIQDIKTPVRVGLVSIALHLVLNFVLMRFMGSSGLALSTAICGILNFAMLIFVFYKRIGDFEIRQVGLFSLKVFAVSLFVGGVAIWVDQCFSVLIAIPAGIAVFVAGCFIVRVHEIRRMFEWIFAKK